MKTKNIIQAQANVIKITSLVKGDTVKIIKSEYSSNEIRYGVVIDLMNDGTKTFIEMLEYQESYNDVDVYSDESGH